MGAAPFVFKGTAPYSAFGSITKKPLLARYNRSDAREGSSLSASPRRKRTPHSGGTNRKISFESRRDPIPEQRGPRHAPPRREHRTHLKEWGVGRTQGTSQPFLCVSVPLCASVHSVLNCRCGSPNGTPLKRPQYFLLELPWNHILVHFRGITLIESHPYAKNRGYRGRPRTLRATLFFGSGHALTSLVAVAGSIFYLGS